MMTGVMNAYVPVYQCVCNVRMMPLVQGVTIIPSPCRGVPLFAITGPPHTTAVHSDKGPQGVMLLVQYLLLYHTIIFS